MKVFEKEFLDMLDKQREIEIKVANELKLTMDKTNNEIVKLLLQVIMMDSLKHAQILQTLKDIIQRKGIFSFIEKYEVKKALEKHILEEQEMLNYIKNIVEKVEERQVKSILGGILAEEYRHHESLKQLYQFIEGEEGLSEENLWDYLNKWANFST
jgi:rubrerythrin